jgi:hypothetical protein
MIAAKLCHRPCQNSFREAGHHENWRIFNRLSGENCSDADTLLTETSQMRCSFELSGLLPQSTHSYVRRPVDLLARRRAGGSPRDLRGFGSCERQVRRREPTKRNTMSALSIAKSRNPKSAVLKKGGAKSTATSRRKVTSAAATAKTPLKADEPKVVRVTKQERVLTLLSQPEGASTPARPWFPGVPTRSELNVTPGRRRSQFEGPEKPGAPD